MEDLPKLKIERAAKDCSLRFACSCAMREKIEALAQANDTSEASILRAIVERFFSENSTESAINVIQERRGSSKRTKNQAKETKS